MNANVQQEFTMVLGTNAKLNHHELIEEAMKIESHINSTTKIRAHIFVKEEQPKEEQPKEEQPKEENPRSFLPPKEE